MVDDKEKAQRRVYVLPKELVDRIVAYQTAMGLQSEVEAARRLLDEALKQREGAPEIIRRFALMMKETKVLTDIAKEVLVGHPKITEIKFDASSVRFSTSDGEEVTFYGQGGGRFQPSIGDSIRFDDDGVLDEIPF